MTRLEMASRPPASILVVDDEPSSLGAVQALLTGPGHQIVVAGSGKEALRQILKRDFALILLDTRMPEMDGFEAASLIRKRRRSLHTPIIFMTTASDDTQSLARSHEIGVVDYIFKPVDPDVLKSKVAAFVDLYRKNADLYAQILQRKDAERELFRANEELERRISERTASLVVANELLHKEIAMREQAEQNLRKSEMEARKLSLVASSTENAVIIKDAANRIEWVNESFTRIYGFGLQECRGRLTSVLVGETAIAVSESSAHGSRRAADVKNRAEVIRIGKDGRKRWLTVECRPITDEEGTATGFIEIETDITERKKAESRLQRTKQAAEAANLAKSQFLANMSHEIRTPMNAIIGMTELVLQTSLSSEQDEYLSLLKASSESLLTVINDILDYSKIEAGHIDIETIPFSLRESLGDTMKTLALAAHRKNLELICEFAPDVPDALLGDPVRLSQIVMNLVGNAIKFTDHGDVIVRVETQATSDGEVVCRFAVSDSGIGIAKEKLASIFEPFLQADTSTTRLYGGTGLGLTISARLVGMMNGTISVESAPGNGSTFYFALPFALQEVSPLEQELVDFQGVRALVVVVHPLARRVLVDTLRQWNMEVVEAESPSSAIALIDRVTAAQAPFRLVLMDVDLPAAGGYEVAMKIQRSPGFASGCLVTLGTSVRRETDDLCGAGPITCLSKPVKRSELIRAIRSVAFEAKAKDARSDVAAAGGVGPAQPDLEILLVEDNPTNRRLAEIVLKKQGHRVVAVDNGVAALESLKRKRFDLVLMDVQMPKMDGIETTVAIRKMEKVTGAHVPVIALTAHAMERDRERCLHAGMDDYLTKPVKPQHLLEAIARLGVVPASQAGPAAGRLVVLDRDELLFRINGDMQLLGEVNEIFRSDCRALMLRARTAMLGGDAEQLAALLHTLNGMFRSIAAHAAQEVTGNLQGLRLDTEREKVEATYRHLEREVAMVEEALLGLLNEGANASPAKLRDTA